MLNRTNSRLIGLGITLFAIPVVAPLTAFAADETTLNGTMNVLWGEELGESGLLTNERHVYSIADDAGNTTKLNVTDQVLQGAGGIMAVNGKRVSVSGPAAPATALDSTGADAGEPVFNVTSLDLQQSDISAASSISAPQISGSQPWVTIMCKFGDIGTEQENLAYFQNMYGSNYPGLDHHWKEQSYNQVDVVGSNAFGWFTLPQPRSYYVYDIGNDGSINLNFNRITNDCTAAADPTVDFSSYVGLNMMFNANLDCCAWGGSRNLSLDGPNRFWRVTWNPPWAFRNSAVIAHEMGHGFGLPHSSGPHGNTYDSGWDVMSSAQGFAINDAVYGNLGKHTISYHKDILDWIPSGLKFDAPDAQSSTVTLERLALPQTGSYRMIQIPIAGSSTNFYTVEVRKRNGYDLRVPGEAVVLHEVNTTRSRPANVVDVDAVANTNPNDAGAQWLVGETFTDAANNISVTVDSATATGFVVTVELNVDGSAPGAATLVSPIGNVTDKTPTYTWNAVSNSTWYYLWVNGPGGSFKQWVRAAQAGCESGDGTCSFTPTDGLALGEHTWWLRTWNDSGFGPWSSSMNFAVEADALPGATSLVSPNGTTTDSTPTYTWNAEANSSWYYVWVNGPAGSFKEWVRAEQAGCASGAGTCSITLANNLGLGNHTWWVRTWNNIGVGPWSSSMNFVVEATALPAAATTISPTGAIGDSTPTYTWNAEAGSSWYYLWVRDSSSNVVLQWYTAAQAGCGSGTGQCSVTPSSPLAGGAHTWWVRTWNNVGDGPWSAATNFSVTPS